MLHNLSKNEFYQKRVKQLTGQPTRRYVTLNFSKSAMTIIMGSSITAQIRGETMLNDTIVIEAVDRGSSKDEKIDALIFYRSTELN